MVFDPVLFSKQQKDFLITLLEHQESQELLDTGEPIKVMLSLSEIGTRSGIPKKTVERISEELRLARLIYFTGGNGTFEGSYYALRPEGRAYAENSRYEKTWLAKRRKAKIWAIDKGGEAAKIGIGKLIAWVGAIIIAGLGIVNAESLAKAIRHLLGY